MLGQTKVTEDDLEKRTLIRTGSSIQLHGATDLTLNAEGERELLKQTKLTQDEFKKLELVCAREDVQPRSPMWDGTKEYKENGIIYPVTWCNRFVYLAMKILGYDATPFLNDTIDYTRAAFMYDAGVATQREIPRRDVMEHLSQKGPLLVALRESKGPSHVGLATDVENGVIFVYEAGNFVAGRYPLHHSFPEVNKTVKFFSLAKD